ncbi:phosphate acyltransferase PlsX [Azomonas macrocytogenes]|uniref:Phosphate acyltransferase n=1 Tax=Azomonas macrocytogenes TaxID=69962 RepID=A0A839T029_AZOMA|nr:phosphate acyltransferase PlsX [Azomonas macrocytogenes]MBB3101866.1 glycerol-3-phosphate acyltransferase PlsX [Azomonas macrocytogenes]
MSAAVIAVDAMGGDFGPRCIVPASLDCLSAFPSLRLLLVGQSCVLEQHVSAYKKEIDHSRLAIVEAEDVVGMDERPTLVLRGKPRSSLHVALEMVRDGQAQACVSAGNSGALMAISRHVLKTLPGVDRPAMCATIPAGRRPFLLLDLGANVDCTAEHLYQFAVMGSMAAQLQGIEQPRIALLNVGAEDIKGNQQVRLAADKLLLADDLNYQGFIEGDGLFRGEADVAVCDGFVGNILLKSSEELARTIGSKIEALFHRRWYLRVIGVLAYPVLRQLRRELMPEQYNGASFLGLQGVVVKSHGNAGQKAFSAAIRRAVLDVEQDLPQRLGARLAPLL